MRTGRPSTASGRRRARAGLSFEPSGLIFHFDEVPLWVDQGHWATASEIWLTKVGGCLERGGSLRRGFAFVGGVVISINYVHLDVDDDDFLIIIIIINIMIIIIILILMMIMIIIISLMIIIIIRILMIIIIIIIIYTMTTATWFKLNCK